MRHAIALTTVLLTVSAATACRRSVSAPTDTVVAAARHRGMSYAHAWDQRAAFRGYGSDGSAESLALLKELGTNWVSITPFGFQRTPQDATIRWGGSRFSKTDEALKAVTKQSQALDINVMLKPHLWLRPPACVGMIEPNTEDGWTRCASATS